MNYTKTNALTARRGFTLIELMVVIAIILVLVGLLSAAVRMAVVKGQEAKNRHDIMQLDISLQAFYTQFNFYPPSRLLLPETLADLNGLKGTPNVASLANDSEFYLKNMFPRLDWATTHVPLAPNPAWVGYDWNGDNRYTPVSPALTNPQSILLRGDQCLVFFLGGIQRGIQGPGFSPNPRDPTALPTTAADSNWTRPLFEFQAGRLSTKYLTGPAQGQDVHPSNTYPSYFDVYQKNPFLYFSSYKAQNGYEQRYGVGDCSGITNVLGNIRPYRDAAGNFFKPNTYQIISAGRNGVFCAGWLVVDSSVTPPGYRVDWARYNPGDRTGNFQNNLDWLSAPVVVNGKLVGNSTASDDQTNFAPGLVSGGQ